MFSIEKSGEKFEKEFNKIKKLFSVNEDLTEDEINCFAEVHLENSIRKNMMRGIKIAMIYKECCEELGYSKNVNKFKQHYFITIRPDENKINFNSFYCKSQEMLKRICFISYSASYEQKGTKKEEIGKGFHIHIIANMKQRSKTEVLRDIYNTVKDYTAFNCIQVDTIKDENNLKKIIKYLKDYESEDNHKIITKIMDEEFRKIMKIPRWCHSIKSVEWQEDLRQPLLKFS